VLAVRALPVVDAARVETLDVLVDPQLLPGRRIDGHEGVVRAAAVDDAADDDRIEVGLARGIRPGDLEPRDVGLVDPGRGDEARAVGPAAVVAPFARGALR